MLSQKQLDVLANAREKLKAKNSERTAKKKLEADAIESEIQSRLSQYKEGLEQKIVKKAISIKKKFSSSGMQSMHQGTATHVTLSNQSSSCNVTIS